MVNDSWPGCRRAIVSVALLYGHVENRVTLCVLFRARAIWVCERLTTFFVLTVSDNFCLYTDFNMITFTLNTVVNITWT